MKTRLFLAAALALASFGCKQQQLDSDLRSDKGGGKEDVDAWAAERSRREAAIQQYFAAKKRDWRWFEEDPIGFNGIPLVLLKTLIVVFPEIWTPDGSLDGLGFGPWPDDYDAEGKLLPARQRRALPYGLVWAPDPLDPEDRRTDNVFFSCGACHSGRVVVNGRIQRFAGGASTEAESQLYQGLVRQTVHAIIETDDPDPSKIKLRQDLLEKIIGTMKQKVETDPNFFYGEGRTPEETAAKAQRAREQFAVIAKNKDVVIANLIGAGKKTDFVYYKMGAQFFRTDAAGRKAPPLLGPRPGQMDAFGISTGLMALHLRRHNFAAPEGTQQPAPFLASLPDDHPFFADLPAAEPRAKKVQLATERLFANHAEWLPKHSGVIDIKSLWMSRDRFHANWDANQGAKARVLSSGMSAVGDPTKVNVELHSTMNDFIESLPPPPYPFDVDTAKAARGEAHFNAECATCHKPRNEAVYSAKSLGVDANRATQVSETASYMVALLYKETCLYGKVRRGTGDWCLVDRGVPVPDTDLYRPIGAVDAAGYKADVLHGIWAQAPYLHNGSVPTLWHMLHPDQRPATFVRGNILYDQQKVGYVWDREPTRADYGNADETLHTHTYDTSLSGQANTGHEHGAGLKPNEKDDLLEYLKTL